MSRMRIAHTPDDCPGPRQAIEELFDFFFRDGAERRFRGAQVGWGLLAAQNPEMAGLLAKLTRAIARGAFLTARPDLREIAIQTVNLHFRCEFSYRSHLAYLATVGLTLETIAALPYWRTSTAFDAQQKLIIEYTLAMADGDVPDALHQRVTETFGEDATGELALAIAHWSFWAMFLNAARPEIET